MKFQVTGSMSGFLPLNKEVEASSIKEALQKGVEEWNKLNDINYDDCPEDEIPTLREQINFWGIEVK